eukprot:241103_1
MFRNVKGIVSVLSILVYCSCLFFVRTFKYLHSLAKFKMSNLMVGIDAKLYHSIYAASDRVKRARMHARRSKYALAFANQYIGRDFKRQCEMTNDEWNYAL